MLREFAFGKFLKKGKIQHRKIVTVLMMHPVEPVLFRFNIDHRIALQDRFSSTLALISRVYFQVEGNRTNDRAPQRATFLLNILFAVYRTHSPECALCTALINCTLLEKASSSSKAANITSRNFLRSNV